MSHLFDMLTGDFTIDGADPLHLLIRGLQIWWSTIGVTEPLHGVKAEDLLRSVMLLSFALKVFEVHQMAVSTTASQLLLWRSRQQVLKHSRPSQ